MRGQVLGTSNDEVVDNDDLVAVAEKAIDQMASDEAGAAGDDAFHVDTIRRRPPNQTARIRRQAGAGDLILQASPICSGENRTNPQGEAWSPEPESETVPLSLCNCRSFHLSRPCRRRAAVSCP